MGIMRFVTVFASKELLRPLATTTRPARIAGFDDAIENPVTFL